MLKRLSDYIRLTRIKIILSSIIVSFFLCVYTNKPLIYDVFVLTFTTICFMGLMSLCELRDAIIDFKKYIKYEFYRKSYNPISVGKISVDECIKFIRYTSVVSTLIAIVSMIIIPYLCVTIIMLTISLFISLIYIIYDRCIIGNIAESLSWCIALIAISYPVVNTKILLFAFGIMFYTLSHNINNQIEDYDIELDIENTIATKYGIFVSKIIGISSIIISGILLYLFKKLLIIPCVIIIISYIINNKKIQDYLRYINYVLIPICLFA